jgi:hypothetical protein
LAFNAFIDNNDIVCPWTKHFNGAAHKNVPASVEGQQIGGPKSLAGYDKNASALHSRICDQRVADHNCGDPFRQSENVSLVEIYRNDLCLGLCRQAVDRA